MAIAGPAYWLPETFSQQDVCKHYAVGQSATIVRRKELGGETRIEVSPLDSVKDEVVFVGIGALFAVPAGFMLAVVRKLWRLWRTDPDPMPS